jgi:tagatose-1,6-bisphosphate aldolase non-catalytic subunit AgaZ/GatZ
MDDNKPMGTDRAMQEADLVIRQGRIVKNRRGIIGTEVPIPDGCYKLIEIHAES